MHCNSITSGCSQEMSLPFLQPCLFHMGKLHLGWQIGQEHHFVGDPLWHEEQFSSHPDVRYDGEAWSVWEDRHRNGRAAGASAPQLKYMPFFARWTESWQFPVITDTPFICKLVHERGVFTNSIKPPCGWLVTCVMTGHIWISFLFPLSSPVCYCCWCFLVPWSEENCQLIVLLRTGHSSTPDVSQKISEPIFCLHERQLRAAGSACVWCLAVCDILSSLVAFLKWLNVNIFCPKWYLAKEGGSFYFSGSMFKEEVCDKMRIL